MVALKLVEVYGFEAASAWADHHVAVPSVLFRYACLVAESATKHGIFCHMSLVSPAAYGLQHQLLSLQLGIGNLPKTVLAENCLAGFHSSLCLVV